MTVTTQCSFDTYFKDFSPWSSASALFSRPTYMFMYHEASISPAWLMHPDPALPGSGDVLFNYELMCPVVQSLTLETPVAGTALCSLPATIPWTADEHTRHVDSSSEMGTSPRITPSTTKRRNRQLSSFHLISFLLSVNWVDFTWIFSNNTEVHIHDFWENIPIFFAKDAAVVDFSTRYSAGWESNETISFSSSSQIYSVYITWVILHWTFKTLAAVILVVGAVIPWAERVDVGFMKRWQSVQPRWFTEYCLNTQGSSYHTNQCNKHN